MSSHSEGIGAAGAKLAPPLTVGGLTVFGIPLTDFVLILAGVYAALQISFLLYDRLFKSRKEKRNGSK